LLPLRAPRERLRPQSEGFLDRILPVSNIEPTQVVSGRRHCLRKDHQADVDNLSTYRFEGAGAELGDTVPLHALEKAAPKLLVGGEKVPVLRSDKSSTTILSAEIEAAFHEASC
jgi:hypothetical protein